MSDRTGARREPRGDPRWVAAPADSDPSVANRVVGVWLARGERVRWTWAALPDGRQYVCGYTIERLWGSPARRGPARCGFRVGE